MVLGYKINDKTFVMVIVGCMVVLGLAGLSVYGEQSQSETEARPWWEQEKIRFFWGQWKGSNREPQASLWNGPISRETMKNLSQVGATVFVETRGLNPANARLAHEYGLRYFASLFLCDLLYPGTNRVKEQMKVRWSVNKEGEPYSGPDGPYACPVYKPVYEECFLFNPEAFFLTPILEAAQEGLVDGLHLDWEGYTGRGEAEECYCDDCFGDFMKKKGLDEDVPKAQRYKWLEERNLLTEYTENFEQRRIEMFRELADRMHEVKPDFVFSGYSITHSKSVFAIPRGLNTPGVPFFVIDSRHYFEDHTRPWWESHHAHYRQLGMRHIAGSWDNALFGGQPESNVSAPQWMYDAAINSDGYWLWFEEELTPDAWRAFWLANRRIRATEQKVGEFLLRGEQDIHFVTAVEWSGNPEFDRKIIQRTYHRGDEHLVHVHNVDTDRPMQIRLRFPRLPNRSRWIVSDPIAELTYVHDGDKALWSARRLKEGIVVSLEKRSELFLKLSPARTGFRPEPATIISSQEIKNMPEHAKAAATAPEVVAPVGPERLVYTVTESLGYLGPQGGWAIGNAIHAIDANGENHQRLRQLKGYLWSPVWSPDGTRIAFCHYANGQGQIYVMNADGSQVVNLSNNNYCDKSPVWSPDGSKLALVSDRDGDWEIYVMNSDGGEQTRLTNSPSIDRVPAWSPDGQRIAFESDREIDFDIYVMNADGTDQRSITNRPGDEKEPTWAPDGTRIACVGVATWAEELLVVGTDSGRVPQRMGERGVYFGSLCWSPDGQRLAGVFRGPQERDNCGIFTINADGTEKSILVNVHATRPYGQARGRGPSPSWYSLGSSSPRWVVKNFGGVCWSPDGTRLAFSSDMGEDGYFYIYTIPAGGGEPTRLEDTRSAWLQQLMWCP